MREGGLDWPDSRRARRSVFSVPAARGWRLWRCTVTVRPPGSRTEAVLAEVFREQSPGLWGFFLRGASESAEDLLQETFLRVWDHRESLRGESEQAEREGARRYIWRVARNLMIDEIRMRQRRGETGAGMDPDGIASPSHESEAVLADAVRAVRETVETLTNRRARRCLQLWLDGQDVISISRRLSLGIDQVRGLLQRGRSEVIRRASKRLRVRPVRPAPERGEAR